MQAIDYRMDRFHHQHRMFRMNMLIIRIFGSVKKLEGSKKREEGIQQPKRSNKRREVTREKKGKDK